MSVDVSSALAWMEIRDDDVWARAYLPYDDEPARPVAVNAEGPSPSMDRLFARAWVAGVRPPFTDGRGTGGRVLPADELVRPGPR